MQRPDPATGSASLISCPASRIMEPRRLRVGGKLGLNAGTTIETTTETGNRARCGRVHQLKRRTSLANIGGTFWKFMYEGGWVMWPLLAFSIIAVAVMIERWLVLRKATINVNEFLAKLRKALIVNKSIRDAIKICEQYRGPLASIMKAGLLKYGQPKEDIEKTIETAALHEMGRGEKSCVVLSWIGKGAPL